MVASLDLAIAMKKKMPIQIISKQTTQFKARYKCKLMSLTINRSRAIIAYRKMTWVLRERNIWQKQVENFLKMLQKSTNRRNKSVSQTSLRNLNHQRKRTKRSTLNSNGTHLLCKNSNTVIWSRVFPETKIIIQDSFQSTQVADIVRSLYGVSKRLH